MEIWFAIFYDGGCNSQLQEILCHIKSSLISCHTDIATTRHNQNHLSIRMLGEIQVKPGKVGNIM